MKRFWPRSLFARLMLIWIIGTLLVQVLSITIFVHERERIWSEGFAQEIASHADMLDKIKPEERQQNFAQQERGWLRLGLHLPKRAQPYVGEHPLLSVLREAMPERQPTLYTYSRENDRRPPELLPLAISVNLAGGDLLTARLPSKPPRPPSYWYIFTALLALLTGLGVLTWICVRIATRPLLNLSAAAQALGEDPERPPLDPTGPTEVVRATEAFNQMQQRIKAHVHERTRILASISHDLQTPITRLRLRAEMIDDETLQSRIQSDLDAMQNLVREGLDYARSMEDNASLQPIDINGLLSALCDDAVDMGWKVSVTGQTNTLFIGHSVALRRALWNLIENGVKFGEIVDISVTETSEAIHILIRDHGQGLPEEEMEKVFAPFYRTESSRNRETGGTGLGLAITRNLLHIQHARVHLDNHPEGGLLATVILPQSSQN